MFRVSTNIEQTIDKKKKLIFISTLSSNETSLFEPKNDGYKKIQSQTISKSSSLKAPLTKRKKRIKFFNYPNQNKSEHKIIPVKPIKRILFRLCRENPMNHKKEKGRAQSHNKKQVINFKQNSSNLMKHKQKHIQTKNNNISFHNDNYSAGRWKNDEHQRFINAIIKYGNNWRQVQKCVGTRSSTQTRSHAQKFFEKLKRSKIFKKGKYDFSKNSLKILHDIMQNLSEKEYNHTLNALLSLSYVRNPNYESDNILYKNNELNNDTNNNCNENKDNHFEEIHYDGNNINNEDNIKCIKFCNQGYCFLDSNYNNRLFNINDDNLFLNNNICNINSFINNNNYLIKDYINFDVRNSERKESDIFSQRKNSLSEMNLNTKEIKEKINNDDDENIDHKPDNSLYNNFFNLNTQMDNKNNSNKIFDINEDKIGYRQQFTNLDCIFNQQESGKMSLEEILD